MQDKICQAIRAGNYIEVAAAYAGIPKGTLYEWLKKGNTVFHNKYRTFHDAVQKALADAEVRDVAVIGQASQQNWQAAAWRLERKFPQRWGRKDRIEAEISGKPEEPVVVKVEAGEAPFQVVVDEARLALARRLALMAKRKPDPDDP